MRLLAFCLLILLLPVPTSAAQGLYDGTSTPYGMVMSQDITISHPSRERGLEVRATWPLVTDKNASAGTGEKLPVFVFSHGAFGSRTAYEPLAAYLAGRGYVVLQPTHADSMRYGTLPLVGNPLSFKDWDERPREVSYLIDKLGLVAEKIPALSALMDQNNIAVGGHSFGAHTTQLLAGMTVRRAFNFTNDKRRSFTDARPKAFVVISPQGTGAIIDEKSFETMTRPALFITGGNDTSPVNGKPYTWRLEAFRFADPHDKYLLFIKDAWHGFGGLSGHLSWKGAGPENKDDLNAVRSTTLAFLDAYVKNDKAALHWLSGDSLRKSSGGRAQITSR